MQEPFAFPAQHQPQMYYQAIPYPPSYMVHPQQPLDDFYPSLRYNANDYADYMGSGIMPDDFGPEMEEISTRPRLTKEQVEVLEAQFQANHKPNSQVKRQLAIQTNLKFQRVGVSEIHLHRALCSSLTSDRIGSKTEEPRQNSRNDRKNMKLRRRRKSQNPTPAKPSKLQSFEWHRLSDPFLRRPRRHIFPLATALHPLRRPMTVPKSRVGLPFKPPFNELLATQRVPKPSKWHSKRPPWSLQKCLNLRNLQRYSFRCGSVLTGLMRRCQTTWRHGLLAPRHSIRQ